MAYICNVMCFVDGKHYKPGDKASVVPPISRKYFDIKGDDIASNKKDINNIQKTLKDRKIKFKEGAHISDLAKLLAKANRKKGWPLDQLSSPKKEKDELKAAL